MTGGGTEQRPVPMGAPLLSASAPPSKAQHASIQQHQQQRRRGRQVRIMHIDTCRVVQGLQRMQGQQRTLQRLLQNPLRQVCGQCVVGLNCKLEGLALGITEVNHDNVEPHQRRTGCPITRQVGGAVFLVGNDTAKRK
eukprot:1159227-Pelagomonas_calceolata.AAC.1